MILINQLTLPDGRVVQFRKPIHFIPNFNQADQLWSIDHPSLYISVFATTLEDLHHELQEQLAVLWMEYAEAPEEELSKPALELRARLWLIA